ncbi:MAG: hypothetical protein SNJ75_13140, partial [Gemmataceae bacterium]
MRRKTLTLESLESRTTPAACLLSDGTLLVQGTEGNDTISVLQSSVGTVSVPGMQILVDNVLVDSVAIARVTAIEVQALGGDDTIRLDSENVPGYVALTPPAT